MESSPLVVVSSPLHNSPCRTSPSSSSAIGGATCRSSPILEFLFFHKAIRRELERLHQDALAVERGREPEFRALADRFCFLRTVYVQHSNAEDEVIFPSLDARVKNVAGTYSFEHKVESELFDQMLESLNSALRDKCNTSAELRRELICCTEAIQTTLCQHLAKEEEQVFPLLMKHFTFEEQATIVWQFMCSIPINLMEVFLPWIAHSLSPEEHREMVACMDRIIPKEKLLRQVIFAWLDIPKIFSGKSECTSDKIYYIAAAEYVLKEDSSRRIREGMLMGSQESLIGLSSCHQTSRKSSALPSLDSSSTNSSMNEAPITKHKFPIDELLLWHKAIRKELSEFAEEAKMMKSSVCTLAANLASFSERLQFLADVCKFHSAAEDRVVFPAVGERMKIDISFVLEHQEEESHFENVRHLLDGAPNSPQTEAELYNTLCDEADLIVEKIEQHLLDEEMRVLPLARKHCSVQEQRVLLYQSLRLMPLKLLERVLPWFSTVLSEDEAKCMLQNMRLAAPVKDSALVTLFSGWACKGRINNTSESGVFKCISSNGTSEECHKGTFDVKSSCCCEALQCDTVCGTLHLEERPLKRSKHEENEEELSKATLPSDNSVKSRYCVVPGLGVSRIKLSSNRRPVKSLSSNHLPSGYLGSGLFDLGKSITASVNTSAVPKPIDTIFQFHKAIRKDLRYLETESAKLTDCDEEFLRQFTGRFLLLWGFYRAHSNAEDEIVFPALESKEALHNVSHSYTIDHKHEEQLFSDMSKVLSDLSQIEGRMQSESVIGISEMMDEVALSSDVKIEDTPKHELASKLQAMCKSIRITLDQHVSREELELWPLFNSHFSVEEQDKIVGRIIGTTGAEVLQAMLPWVTTALTQEEQGSLLDTWRQASRNTMFDKWLSGWWSTSPSHSSAVDPHRESEFGAAECLQMVADYLSNGVSNENIQNDDGMVGNELVEPKNANKGKSKHSVHPHSLESKDVQIISSSEIQPCQSSKVEQMIDKVDDAAGKFKPGWQDIFRMNQKELEAAIRKVSSDTSLDPRRKAYLMQNLMTSRWIVAQQQQQPISSCNHGHEDIPGGCPSYQDQENGVFGCEHYRRNCKIRAACCGLLFPCRFCHDKVSDHSMNRQDIKEMMCMKCLKVQPVAQYCSIPSCNGFQMARYFCSICKLFDDDNRDIYHCPFCNLCRVGKGLGIDFFHCMTCNACMSMKLSNHKCREKGLEVNCPICHDFLFTSNLAVKGLVCGHFMHSTCFQAYTYSHYTCPICSKSLGDMGIYFGMLDALLAAEHLPDEYRHRQQEILCNDCEQRSMSPFHWLYHKCSNCGSYNTRAI